MISEAEYLELDGVGQAALLARGDVSPAELLEAAIARAERVNPQLNAVIIPMYEIARARARTPLSGKLAGVPFLIKDLHQDYAGVLATAGCRALRRTGHTATVHAEFVKRALDAGLVIFGCTNTPEFGAKGVTEPEAWGPTNNPWDPERSPGGSSGGSAAAVAAGIAPLAGASDGGGSIRIPAAWTGLFGFKPGRARTPCGPGTGETFHGAVVHHVLTRSVRDSAAMLDALHGREVGSPVRLAPPGRPYREEVAREPGPLRVAFSTRSPLCTPVDAAAVEAVEQTAALLEGLGHRVEPAAPPIDGRALVHDFLIIWMAQMAVEVARVREHVRTRTDDFEFDTLVAEALSEARSARAYADSYVRWCEYGYQLDSFLRDHDVYLTPTVAAPAPPARGPVTTSPRLASAMRALMPLGFRRVVVQAESAIMRIFLRVIADIPFTQLANVAGVPAMSVPLHSFHDGLPLGVQFLGEQGSEGTLLALAGQLERAAPWHARRPRLPLRG